MTTFLRIVALICLEIILINSQDLDERSDRNLINDGLINVWDPKEPSPSGMHKLIRKQDDKSHSTDQSKDHESLPMHRNQMKLSKICLGKFCMSKKEIQFILNRQRAQKKLHKIGSSGEIIRINRIFRDNPQLKFLNELYVKQ